MASAVNTVFAIGICLFINSSKHIQLYRTEVYLNVLLKILTDGSHFVLHGEEESLVSYDHRSEISCFHVS